MAGLSKGQQRVLKFLMSLRDTRRPSQTTPVGYDTISKACFLSRSGSRKVISELSEKGLIRRLETKRGGVQGSVYILESNILYITQSSTPNLKESSIQAATVSNTPTYNSSSSSSKEQLLQELNLEDAFQDLNPRSLMPYLDRFDHTDEVQNFLDMANACIAAAREGRGKLIKNPHGFLFAQLREGYINPPEGYKSRKLRVQEIRNRQLEEELVALRQLKEREQELRFELFKGQLTANELDRLKQKAREQVNPKIGMSTERQLEVAKEEILRQWFAQRERA
jgi:hypothetical protein